MDLLFFWGQFCLVYDIPGSVKKGIFRFAVIEPDDDDNDDLHTKYFINCSQRSISDRGLT